MYRRIHTAQPRYVRPYVLVYVHMEHMEASGFGISLRFVAVVRIELEL